MKNVLCWCLLSLSTLYAYGQVDTFRVHFPFNDAKVSKQSADFIDRLIYKDILIHGQKLIVLGYTDYVGDNAYNETLSATRAKNVQDYLISSGFDKNDIKLCIGKGKIEREPVNGKDGFAADRKVQIIIDRTPPIDTLSANKSKAKKDTAFTSLSSLKVNSTYQLNIMFENSSSTILPESNSALESLLKFMVRNPSVSIQIEGHVCCMNPWHNGDGVDVNASGPLSWNRAKAIYNFLAEHNINKSRLKYIGLAGTVPLVYPERTQKDEAKNRRVEIRILSK